MSFLVIEQKFCSLESKVHVKIKLWKHEVFGSYKEDTKNIY